MRIGSDLLNGPALAHLPLLTRDTGLQPDCRNALPEQSAPPPYLLDLAWLRVTYVIGVDCVLRGQDGLQLGVNDDIGKDLGLSHGLGCNIASEAAAPLTELDSNRVLFHCLERRGNVDAFEVYEEARTWFFPQLVNH